MPWAAFVSQDPRCGPLSPPTRLLSSRTPGAGRGSLGVLLKCLGHPPKDLWPQFPFIILPRTASPPVCQVSGEGLPFRGRQQSRGSFPGQLPMEMSSCRAAACPGVLQLPGSRSLAGDVGQAGTGGQICAQHRRGHEHSPLTWFGSHREVLGGAGTRGCSQTSLGLTRLPSPQPLGAAPR